MSIAFTTCPKCGTLVLDDAAQCHMCAHIFDSQRVISEAALPTDEAVNTTLDRCPKCQATCRSGLVRCWSCSAFLRAEMEEAYNRKIEQHGLYTAVSAEPDAAALASRSTLNRPQSTPTAGTKESLSKTPVSMPTIVNPSSGPEQTDDDAATDDDDFEMAADVHFSQSAAFPVAYEEEPSGYAIPTLNWDTTANNAEEPPLPSIPLLSSTGPSSGDVEEPPIPIDPAAVAQAAKERAQAEAADSLLDIARQEEQEVVRIRKDIRRKLGQFVVYCPMGCKIRVHERHRGRTGKCPKCSSFFVVPLARTDEAETPGSDAAIPASTVAAARYQTWIENVHLHNVVAAKLRMKADSLLNDYQTVDLGLTADGLLLVTLITSAGLFGAGEKKKPAVRTAVREYLEQHPTPEGLPAPKHQWLPSASLSQLLLSQPPAAGTESLFSGIPLFGSGRIAVRLPRTDETSQQYLSFSLIQYRDFVKALGVCGRPTTLNEPADLPLADEYESLRCGLTGSPVRGLKGLAYYQQLPSIKLKLTGWKCAECGFAISETGREKEKLGGANGKALAKTSCPKCAKKFGSQPMYELPAEEPAVTAPA